MAHDAHDSASHADPAHGHGHGGGHVMHIIPVWKFGLVLLALLVLTFVTVAVVWTLDLGPTGNVWLAMVIATVKATLVLLYFMHLRYEKPVIALVLISALAFVALFVGMTLMDADEYQHYITEYRFDAPTEADIDRRFAPDRFIGEGS